MKQFHILICMFTGAVKDVTTIYFNDYWQLYPNFYNNCKAFNK